MIISFIFVIKIFYKRICTIKTYWYHDKINLYKLVVSYPNRSLYEQLKLILCKIVILGDIFRIIVIFINIAPWV